MKYQMEQKWKTMKHTWIQNRTEMQTKCNRHGIHNGTDMEIRHRTDMGYTKEQTWNTTKQQRWNAKWNINRYSMEQKCITNGTDMEYKMEHTCTTKCNNNGIQNGAEM